MSAVKIAACRPYSVSLARRERLVERRRRRRSPTTGPNTSLRAHLHVRRDVGEHASARARRRRSSSPPVATLAPPATRLVDPRRHPVALAGRDERRHVGGLVERVADDERCDPLDQRGGEVVGDRAVHVDPLRRDAALAGVGEAGDLDLVGRRLPVAVGLDDDRRVVAQLEPDPLARRPGPDAPADVGRAGERDQGDVGVVDEGVADRAAAAGDDAAAARRGRPHSSMSSSARAMAENGVWLRRLEHDRAAGGDRRRQLVGDEVEREVERADRADHADRHPQREAELALARRGGVERDHLAGQRAGLGGGELERADGALGLDPGRLDRLGRLGGDDAGELLAALGEQPGGACRGSRPASTSGSGPGVSARPWPTATARSTSAAVHAGTAPMTDPS